MVKLLYFLRAAFAGLRMSPFVHFVASLAIGVALFSAGLSSHGVRLVNSVLDSWGAEAEITFYLKGEVTPEAAETLVARVGQEEGGQARLVTPEAALERLRAEFGEAGGVLANLPKNPLPWSIELNPPAGHRSASAIAVLAARWVQAPEVESVEYGREWLERLESLATAARGAGALVLLIVLAAAVVVVAATLQLAIYARREEIEIQKLVGATDAFVKAPFLFEGIFQGLFGASLAAGGLHAFSHYMGPRLSDALSFLSGGLVFPRLIDLHGWLELCVVGACLGLVGSLVAVRRFLRL